MSRYAKVIASLIAKHGGNKSEIARKLSNDTTSFSSQLLGLYERGERKPKADFFRRWKEVFKDDIETMAGDDVSHETFVSTPSSEVPEAVYKNLVEANSEYRLIPKSVLEDKYRIVSLIEIEKEARDNKEKQELIKIALAEKDGFIEYLKSQVIDLTNRLNTLQA